MSFLTRVALAAATAVALAIGVSSVAIYAATSNALYDTVDRALRDVARAVDDAEAVRLVDGQFVGGVGVQDAQRPGERPPRGREDDRFGEFLRDSRNPRFGGPGVFVQVVDASGATLTAFDDDAALPVTEAVRAVAAGTAEPELETVEVEDRQVRTIAVPLPVGTAALQLGRDVTEIEESLASLRVQLAGYGVVGVLLATLAGFAVARRAVAPVTHLREATDRVIDTGDLSHRIEVGGTGDELDLLASRFNDMLGSIEAAQRAQQQLVADASHELRTPLTSLRTNIEVLRTSGDRLRDEDRVALLGDVEGQLEEFGALVQALVELARGDLPVENPVELRLDELTEGVVERLRVHRRDVTFEVDAEASVVVGAPDRIERAVRNLVDNAAKYAGDAGPVEITVRDGVVRIRDRGPGIPDEERERVFERFYRAATARGAPGSGLGLSIVRQVARTHGGDVTLSAAPGGGLLAELRLPTSRQATPSG